MAIMPGTSRAQKFSGNHHKRIVTREPLRQRRDQQRDCITRQVAGVGAPARARGPSTPQ